MFLAFTWSRLLVQTFLPENLFFPGLGPQLVSDLSIPMGKLNAKIELDASIFEGTDFLITIIIDVHDNWDLWLLFVRNTQQQPDLGFEPETS